MTASTGERDDREDARDYPEGPGDIPADTFALRLVASRHHAGHLSIREAADKCGLNRGSWQDWERGRRPQDMVDVARAVANGLGMNFNWLLLGGSLLPARGRPTRKVRRITDGYPRVAVRPSDGRPNGRSSAVRPSVSQTIRRPQVIVRPQRVAV